RLPRRRPRPRRRPARQRGTGRARRGRPPGRRRGPGGSHARTPGRRPAPRGSRRLSRQHDVGHGDVDAGAPAQPGHLAAQRGDGLGDRPVAAQHDGHLDGGAALADPDPDQLAPRQVGGDVVVDAPVQAGHRGVRGDGGGHPFGQRVLRGGARDRRSRGRSGHSTRADCTGGWASSSRASGRWMSLTAMFTSITSSPVMRSTAVITLRRTARASSTIDAPYSTTMSRSIAACFSPTSTCTPAMLAAPVPPPGIRSRIAPNARETPPPIECTPEISRAAMPAIFWTTEAAMVVLPWEVSSASRAGDGTVVVGVVVVGVAVLSLMWSILLHPLAGVFAGGRRISGPRSGDVTRSGYRRWRGGSAAAGRRPRAGRRRARAGAGARPPGPPQPGPPRRRRAAGRP